MVSSGGVNFDALGIQDIQVRHLAKPAWHCLLLFGLVAAMPSWAQSTQTGACTANAAPGDDLQAAIDRAGKQADPATLCLAGGEYLLDNFVNITRDGFTLRGQGVETVIRLHDGAETPAIVVGDYRKETPGRRIHDVTLEKMRLIGSGPDGSELHAEFPYLRNSVVVVRAGERVTVRELQVSDCRSACILTEYHSSQITIVDNVVSHAAWDGISLNRGGRTVIRGNLLQDNVAAGITTEFLENSVIEDNRFIGNGSHGVYLADANSNTFRNNRFEGNAGAGIYLTCSIRYRDPVLCWDNSMSHGNRFEHNVFQDNGFGYLIGVDSAANCKRPNFEANLSRNEVFRNSENSEPDWNTYGYCLRYEGSRTE